MSVNLVKGEAINLTKAAGGDLKNVEVTINWKENTTSGADFDPDVAAFICGDDGKVLGEPWAVYFAQKTTPKDEVVHSGDDRTGGTGETISVKLDQLPALATAVDFSVAIYHATARNQNFGAINGLKISVNNADTGEEIATSDLSFEDSVFTSINFGRLERHGDAWGFRSVGEGYNEGLKRLFEDHGISVEGDDYDEGLDK